MSEWGSGCWKCKVAENRQQNCKRESPAALTECHLQLAANFISLQEYLVNLKHRYELHTESRSWWSWKKIVEESQQVQQRDFPSSFPTGSPSLSLVKARHYLFWPVHLCEAEPDPDSDPGCTHRHHGLSLLLSLLLPFPLWIPNERIMLLSSKMVDIYIFNYILIFFILNSSPSPQKNPNWQETTVKKDKDSCDGLLRGFWSIFFSFPFFLLKRKGKDEYQRE